MIFFGHAPYKNMATLSYRNANLIEEGQKKPLFKGFFSSSSKHSGHQLLFVFQGLTQLADVNID